MTFDIDINIDELKLHLENMRKNTSDPIKFRHYTSAFFRAAKRINAYHDLSAIAKREGLISEKFKERIEELKEKYGWTSLGVENNISKFVYQKRNIYDHEKTLKLAIAARVSIPKINLHFEIEVRMEDFYGEWKAPLEAKCMRNGITYDIAEKYWIYEYRYFFRGWMPEQELSMTSEGPDALEICEKYFEYAKEYSSKLKTRLIHNGLIER